MEVITVYLDLEPVPFNKGFYSDGHDLLLRRLPGRLFPARAAAGPIPVSGVSVFNKKVILLRQRGQRQDVQLGLCAATRWTPSFIQSAGSCPRRRCQVAEPIGLSARLCEPPDGHRCDACCRIPDMHLPANFGGEFETGMRPAALSTSTIGVFTIVQIVRNVQMLIPAYDFCVPEKECVTTCDNPCELFRRIEFPTDEFFPPKVGETGCGCGCRNRKPSCSD